MRATANPCARTQSTRTLVASTRRVLGAPVKGLWPSSQHADCAPAVKHVSKSSAAVVHDRSMVTITMSVHLAGEMLLCN